MNLELVSWIDSIRHADGWDTVEHYQREAQRPLDCETVGFIVHEDDASVMVAQSRMVGEGGCVTEVIQIPKIAITARVDLGQTAKKARA